MKSILPSLGLALLLTSCASTSRLATDAFGAAGGAALGNSLSDGDPLLTAAGAAGGLLVGEAFNHAQDKKTQKSYTEGYDQGRSDAVKQQYWLLVDRQRADADQVIGQLRLPSAGQLLGQLQRSSTGATSLTNTSGGLFRPIESIDISGVEIPRNEELYRKYGALEDTETNYRTVHEESAARIQTLKESISDTTTALQSATTDAEVQKLQGTLASQNAQLTALQGDVQNAAVQVIIQDALNRNDAEKQKQAEREKSAAEWGITNKNFDRILTIPSRNAR